MKLIKHLQRTQINIARRELFIFTVCFLGVGCLFLFAVRFRVYVYTDLKCVRPKAGVVLDLGPFRGVGLGGRPRAELLRLGLFAVLDELDGYARSVRAF